MAYRKHPPRCSDVPRRSIQRPSETRTQPLAEYARERGVRLLRLETGIHQKEAIRLYEGSGFRRISPFGEYKEDPLSLFFEKRIA